MKKNSKIVLAFVILILALGFYVMNNQNGSDEKKDKPTGKVIDISERNGKLIFANVGDSLLVRLVGNTEEDFQWTFRNPISGNILTLERHDVLQEGADIKEGQFVSEWKLLIEKEEDFELLFQYESALDNIEPKEVFRTMIITSSTKAGADNIFVLSPKDDEVVNNAFTLKGYARVFEATVSFELLDSDGELILEDFTTAEHGAPEWGYFEKEIEFDEPKTVLGKLEVFEISQRDGLHVGTVIRNVAFTSAEFEVEDEVEGGE